VSYSDPPWPKPLETLPRASRSAPSPSASATPSASTEAVLLGPADGGRLQPSLTAYCRQSSEADAVAVPTDAGWACRAPAAGDGTIDMDRVCRWYYGDDAWAATLDDDDEFSWRCYRD
jgi:hypothetical protein